jgi:UDP-2,3-diacylglucosamine pyrophosphatase LpxH
MDYIIGDIHGRTYWKEVQEVFNPEKDQVFILGDYFGSREENQEDLISPEKQIENFHELCMWALDHEGKVFLLLGNHDLQYMGKGGKSACFNHEYAKAFNAALNTYMDILKLYVIQGDTIYSHAGISSKYFDSIDELYVWGGADMGKDTNYNPTWIRPNDLMATKIPGYKQVVGHTPTQVLDVYGVKVDEHLGLCKRAGDILFVDTYGKDILAIDTQNEYRYHNTTGNIKHDKSLIMKRAHQIRKERKWNMSQALKEAWREAKFGNPQAEGTPALTA